MGRGASANKGRGTGNNAMLWILIVLQQPLAKSVHPLHVPSWERHGADEDMQETLKHFAAFCGQSPQALAKEIQAMSPAVKKRFEGWVLGFTMGLLGTVCREYLP